MRATRGFDVTEETFSVETTRAVCFSGPDNFWDVDEEIDRMESNYFYPALEDRRTPRQRSAAVNHDLLERTRVRTLELLRKTYPTHFHKENDKDIRTHIPLGFLGMAA